MLENTITDMIKLIFGTDYFSVMVGILTESPTNYPDAWQFVTQTYNNIMLPIGYGIMVIYFLVALMEKSTTEQFNLEQMFKLFIKLLVVKIFLDNGLVLLGYCMSLGSNLLLQFRQSGALDGMENFQNMMIQVASDETGGFDLLPSLGFIIQLLIPYAGSIIIQIVAKFVCYSRLIEIMIRTIIAPVAFGDMFTEGTSGSGFRYLKNYLAVCLQGVVIFCIALLFSYITADVMGSMVTTGANGTLQLTGSYGNFFLTYLVMGFACISLVVKSLSLAKELVGTA